MAKGNDVPSVVLAAMLCAAAMIAQQVAGKAARDGIFLSTYDITLLPVMLSVSALASILVVLWTSRLMRRLGPGRIVPAAFAASAIVQLGIWAIAVSHPKVSAIAIYLHIAIFGSVLVSGFWSLFNERLDPRTARASIARVAGGGTLGGLLGGVLAERMAVYVGVTSILPLLAVLHLVCAWQVLRLIPPEDATVARKIQDERKTPGKSGLQILRQAPYLRNLALVILLGTISAALLDYVFKAQAAARLGSGETLVRFFATYYVVVGLLTFAVQTIVSRRALERLGLPNTVASLPLFTSLGSLAGLLVPGLASIGFARGSESVMRNSLFRSGYELFFTPITERDKRATKSIIDVGSERIGDILGGALARGLLFVAPLSAQPIMLALALSLGIVGLLMTRILHRGYVQSLERSLVNRAIELDMTIVGDRTTRATMLQTLTSLDLRDHLTEGPESPDSGGKEESKSAAPSQAIALSDPLVGDILDLRSGDIRRITRIFKSQPILNPVLAGHVIPLLAWDDLSGQAIRALKNIAPAVTGQLIDVLLDRKQEFAIRRRIPRVLVATATHRAADGLVTALRDRRFEVRFQCGRALAVMRDRNPKLVLDKENVFQTVLREVAVDRRIWESQRLLDQSDKQEASPIVDAMLRDRTNRSLEHVFTVLSLVLPKEPLKIAFKGLHTDDEKLRGTALEYLESVLPDQIRAKLWPFLERPKESPHPPERSRKEILDDLLHSDHSIQISLKELQERIKKES